MIAFFDVDGTLTARPTMYRLLRHLLGDDDAFGSVVAQARAMAAAGKSRDDVLLACFAQYAGRRAADVAAAAEDWFAREYQAGGFFLPGTGRAFAAHRARGDVTALVSGSVAACLRPVARHLGASVVLCSELEEAGGVLTGRVPVLMTGAAKVTAVRELAARLGTDLAACHAYGDDASDLPMMAETGTATVIGDDPVLCAEAVLRGWGRLPGAAGPSPAAPACDDGRFPPAPTAAAVPDSASDRGPDG